MACQELKHSSVKDVPNKVQEIYRYGACIYNTDVNLKVNCDQIFKYTDANLNWAKAVVQCEQDFKIIYSGLFETSLQLLWPNP